MTRTLTVKVEVDTESDRIAVWKDGIGWVEMDRGWFAALLDEHKATREYGRVLGDGGRVRMSESCTHEVVTMTEFCPDCGAVFVPERGWTDIPALLAVAEAAAAAELLCSDMCPAHYDEPCSCGRAALRAALDAL